MDRAMLQEYRSRWQAVTAVEQEEQQSASLTENWQQLNAILRLAIGLDLQNITNNHQINAVRQRWIRLKADDGKPYEGQR